MAMACSASFTTIRAARGDDKVFVPGMLMAWPAVPSATSSALKAMVTPTR